MPLRTACSSCGKKLQVRDELAGKKVKCPGCQTVFVAASVNGETAVKAAPTRPAPAAPKLPDTVKDKVSSKPMAKRPPAPPPPIDEDEERDDEEEQEEREERRSKKRKKAAAGSLLWLWLTLAGVVVIGGGLAAYFLFFSGPAPAPVAQNKTPQVNQQPPPPPPVQVPAGPLALADLVPGDAILFISGSPEVLRAQALAPLAPQIQGIEPGFQKQMGFPLGDVERASAFSVVGVERFQQKEGPVVVLVQTKKPFDPQQVETALKSGDMSKNPDVGFEILSNQTVVFGAKTLLQEFKNKKGQAKATGVLQRAIQQAGTSKGVVAAAVIPPEAFQQAAPLLQNAPPNTSVFFKTQAVLASLDLSDRLMLNATLSMSDAAAAQEAKKSLDDFLKGAPLLLGFVANDPQWGPLAKTGQQALKDVRVTQQDKDVTIIVQADRNMIAAATKAVMAGLQGARAAMSGDNNLKQIGLAWHSYHSVTQMFPPQTVGKGLSWRVAILPYLEQGELYGRFNLKEPWDSPQNKKLIPLMPPIYVSPGRNAPPGFTFFQTFVGPNTVNKDKQKGMRLAEIRDGTSNTILVAEADQAVEWTKPADIEVAPSQPIRLGGANPGHTSAVNGDGSIRHLPRNLDQQILRWLIDPSDGNPIPGF